MLKEDTLFGVRDKVEIAKDRLRAFEPEEGYYLAFSGGKDSQCIYHLAKEAGVKFDAHYNLTTLDPPELVQFIKRKYPDVIITYPKESMWRLIEKKGLPTRLKRWCCAELKERGGEGRICVTGVRWAESNARKERRPFEVLTAKKENKVLFDDNDEGRMMFENCVAKGKRVVNPIVDWLEEDVWEYLKSRKIEYCKLYDEGFKRLGCIGCPMTDKGRIFGFERYPKIYGAYFRAVERFLPGYIARRKKKGIEPLFNTAKEMMDWWIHETLKSKELDGQIDIFEDED